MSRTGLDLKWDRNYDKLCTFQRKFGHCTALLKPTTYKSPYNWVVTQRGKKKKVTRASLSQEQINHLEQLGFVWNPLESRCGRRLEQLCAFQRKHGHCNVPYPSRTTADKEFEGFGSWVRFQRAGKKGKWRCISQDRIPLIAPKSLELQRRQSIH
jgi:hypothetical protein